MGMSSEHTDEGDLLPPAGLREMVARDMAALARRRRSIGATVAVATLAIIVGLARGFGLAPELSAKAWIVSALLSLLGLGLFALAFGLILPPGRRLRPLIAVGVIGGVASLLLLSDFSSSLGMGEGFWAMGFSCLKGGTLASVAILGTALFAGRRVLRRHAPTGLLLGLGAGLLGLVPVSTHCIADVTGHIMIWHSLVPIVACGLAGILWSFGQPASEDEAP